MPRTKRAFRSAQTCGKRAVQPPEYVMHGGGLRRRRLGRFEPCVLPPRAHTTVGNGFRVPVRRGRAKQTATPASCQQLAVRPLGTGVTAEPRPAAAIALSSGPFESPLAGGIEHSTIQTRRRLACRQVRRRGRFRRDPGRNHSTSIGGRALGAGIPWDLGPGKCDRTDTRTSRTGRAVRQAQLTCCSRSAEERPRSPC